MFCPKCGQSNAEHFKFCLHCGEDLEQARAATPAAMIPTAQGPMPAHHAQASPDAAALVKQMLNAGSAAELAQLAMRLNTVNAPTWSGPDEPASDPPSPAPRPLPSGFYRDHASINAGFLIGLGGLFGGVGLLLGFGLVLGGAHGQTEVMMMGLLFGVLMGGGGSLAFILGVRGVLRARHIWQVGHVTTGKISSVGIDRSTRINGKNPAIVRYAYTVDGRSFEGEHRSTAQRFFSLQVGQPFHVVYDPKHPDRALLAHNQPRALTAQGGW